ncbi:MAG: hypothetical protein F2817_11505 [Actinobacteria bacterium]|nr:hypothetical protein [Actinomycetota bacterium]
MPERTTPPRHLRTVLPLVAVAALVVLPASAAAAGARPAKLKVTAVSAPPSALKAGERFTVTGKVRNSGGRSSAALVSFELRSRSGATIRYAVGSDSIAKVRPGSTRTFRARARLAPSAALKANTTFMLTACAKRTRRDGTTSCRQSPRGVRVPANAVPVPPTPAPAPAPAPTPTPTPTPVPTPPADPTAYASGARTLGDSLFPTIGNGGYDALHYDLDLRYADVVTRVLRGTATVTAKATQDLSDFSLDFQGTAVSRVSVDGAPAGFALDLDANKLVVTPAAGIRSGSTFVVRVEYGGVPTPVIDPDGSSEGWLSSPTYGAVALGEPLGSQGWFPANNVPFDKATFDVRVTSPSAFTGASNGVLESTTVNDDGTTTYDWHQAELMAPYLATVSIGRFDASGSDLTTNPARPNYVYVDRSFAAGRTTIVANQQRVPSILDFYASYYDVPYPFAASGGIVPRVDRGIGYVLETQTKPTYPSSNATSTGAGIETIAHENAHQWFGNLVTLRRWRDIWLNEGLTEFSSWLWSEETRTSPQSTRDRFDALYAGTSTTFWNIAPADPPTAADIFDSDAMYDRGAMVGSALRAILGETTFKEVMHDWLVEHRYANGTTADFIAIVKRDDPSTAPDRGARWDEFFDQWLYTSYSGDPAAGNKPQIEISNFGTYALPAR